MDIKELQDYRLSDAVKFNDQLNPVIWGSDERLLPQVREGLLAIAEDFKEFLGLDDLKVQDITISGSNAAYTYTPHSDIDLHLVVDIPNDPVYRELFDAKKYQYNDQHNFKVGGYDVELYVQDADQPHYSQGIYSVLNNDWVSVPKRRRPEVNDISVKSKYEDLGQRIEAAIASGSLEQMDAMAGKIKNLRSAGLEQTGEFGPENLAFKILRNNGTLDQLRQARLAAKDSLMSLEERKKKKKKKKRYGAFGGMWFPGYHYYGSNTSGEVDGGAGDGGGESKNESISEQLDRPTPEPAVIMRKHGMSEPEFLAQLRQGIAVEMEHTKNARSAMEIALDHLNERPDYYTQLKKIEAQPLKESADIEEIVDQFVKFVQQRLDIDNMPSIKIKRDPAWSERNKTFGMFVPDSNILYVSVANRHIMDVLRTLAHELTHHRQEEVQGMPDDAGITGSSFENEANAVAGILMRDFGQAHPEYFENNSVDEGLKDKLGAVAAAACIAGTPGCATTSSADVVRGVQDVGRTVQTFKNYGSAGAEEELRQAVKDMLRKKRGVQEASGYIPTNAQKNDPRFSMALTQDIRPGQTGKEANKLGLQTDSQGRPALLMKKLQNTLNEFKQQPLNENRLLDLTKMYQGYNNVVGQVLDDTTKKTKIKIVVADGRGKLRVGDVIHVSPHYLKNVPVAEDCWDGYKQVGMKKKGDRMVPNCVQAEAEELDEVRMSPTALSKFANSEAAEGIRAGFEAELIFRDTNRDDDSGEMEADYDYDERARSIDDVVEFFMYDDYGYGLSPRSAERLRNQLDEAYFEWRDDQIIDAFNRESEDLVREVLLEERPMDERILSALTDGIGLDDADADRIMAIGNKAPRFTKSSEQTAYKEANPGYDQYLEAVNIADEVLDEEVEASIDRQDESYDQALENFRDDYDEDDSSFFSDIGLRWMSDVANEYGLDWPYMTGGGGGTGGREWEEIAGSLQDATGMEVRVGSGYHSTKRGDYYVLEPDGSLDPDDIEDAGLEIVSPPMPLNQAIEQMQRVIEWANSEGNAYTNRSTGLHMGVSIPFKGGDVDYLKLILFMGDKYVLEKFGRAANTYTASAMEKLRQNVAGSKNRNDDKIASALELMKGNLRELAQRYVQQGVGGAKYTSAHIKDGYIEFRSPGGDYLAKADEEINVLEDTMRRFAYAMYLAGRPDLERPEYYKKLYKLIAPEGNRDLELFSKFSSGEITAEELKKQWAEKVISKEVPTDNKKSNWRLYNRRTGEPVSGQDYSNYTELDAIERAKAKVSPASSMTDFNQTYELRDVGTNTGRWRVIRRDNHETLEIIDAVTRGEAGDQAYEKYTDVIPYYIEPYGGNQDPEPEPNLSRRAKLAKQIAQPRDYVIVNKHSLLPFYTFRASTMSQAVDFAVTYLKDKDLDVGNFTVQRASNVKQAVDNAVDSRRLQQTLDPQVRDIDITIDQDAVQYEIVDRRTNRVVLQYSADSADDAGDKFNTWLRNQGMPADTENYGYRLLQSVFENFNKEQAEETRLALDLMSQKAGYKNFSAVPDFERTSIMRQTVLLLKQSQPKNEKYSNNLNLRESVDFAQMQPQQIVAVAQDAFAQLYPGVKLYGKSVVEGVGLTTAKGGEGSASAFAGSDTQRGAFYLTVNAYAEGDAMIVVVEDATAGNYKGAATAVIQALFEAGERLYQTEQRELVINDNANAEAWSVIADRVGAEMMESTQLAEAEEHNFTTAYHITTQENAEEIDALGLRPKEGNVYLVVDEGDPKKLKQELSTVAGWIYARTEQSDEELNLLKINIRDIPLTYRDGWYRSLVPISADRIENLGPDPFAGL
jgi:hypothetical protein